MIFMIILVCFHSVFFAFLALGWTKMKKPESKANSHFPISILVPFRNEAHRIQQLFTSLASLKYGGSWEVVFINDHSDDSSVEIVKNFILKNPKMLATLTESEEEGKKAALSMGVNVARYDCIVTLDADCAFSSGLLSEYNTAFMLNNQFVAGPVAMVGNSFFEKLQQIEFSGLNAAGAVLINYKSPVYCNGANMGYRKGAFIAVHGYSGNEQIPSGDDQFLLQKMAKKFPEQIAYLKSEAALVSTSPEKTFKKLVAQRIRWSSKWKNLKSMSLFLGSGLFYISYMAVPLAFVFAIYFGASFWIPFILFSLKFIFEWRLIHTVKSFYKINSSLKEVFLLQIIYPFFVIFLGFASIFGSYSWKGRRYDR